jgi:hypothetical protein
MVNHNATRAPKERESEQTSVIQSASGVNQGLSLAKTSTTALLARGRTILAVATDVKFVQRQ